MLKFTDRKLRQDVHEWFNFSKEIKLEKHEIVDQNFRDFESFSGFCPKTPPIHENESGNETNFSPLKRGLLQSRNRPKMVIFKIGNEHIFYMCALFYA